MMYEVYHKADPGAQARALSRQDQLGRQLCKGVEPKREVTGESTEVKLTGA